jgi:hypothetical protein
MKAFPMLVLAAAAPLFLSGCGAPTSIATNTGFETDLEYSVEVQN